jgi:hypothetical protein
MPSHRTLSLIVPLIIAFASPALASSGPLTLEKFQSKAEKIAPPFPTLPGKRLCVCQTVNSTTTTYLGYLNSIQSNNAGDVTVNLVCAYPVFTPGLGTGYCSLFEVVK